MFSLARIIGISLRATLAIAVLAALPGGASAQPVAKAGFLDAGSFSLPAQGDGFVETPRALAWSPAGEVHVVDERTGVVVFNESGTFLRRYGDAPIGRLEQIAIDENGVAYLLDKDRKVVGIYGPDGERRYEAGGEVDGPGGLGDPIDLALGPNGLLYVLDRDRRKIQVYSPDGTAIQEILLPIGTEKPRSLTIARTGHMYVADDDLPTAILTLPPLVESLTLVGQNVSGGRLLIRGAELDEPIGMIATPTGTVVLGDRDDGVVWAADAAGGAPIGTTDRLYGGEGTGRGSFERLEDVALVGSDELILLDRDARKVERVSLLLEGDRTVQETMDYPVLVQRVAADLGGAVVAAAPTGRATTWFALADREGRGIRIVEAENEPIEGVYGGTIGIPSRSTGGVAHDFGSLVEKATDVALNDTLAIVVEEDRNRFHVLDLRSGDPIGVFGDNYRDERRLRDPVGAALFRDGRVAIADKGNDRVVVFSPDLATLLGAWPVPDVVGVRLSPADRLFAWNEEGFVAGEVPLTGGALIPLPAPVSIGGVGALGFDLNGNLYVVQKNSSRVAIMDAQLQELLARLGSRGDLRQADRIAVDGEGNIFATDSESGATQGFRWGVEVPPIESVSTLWTAESGLVEWKPVEGSFVTGYRVEGADGPDGPWTTLADLDQPRWQAGPEHRNWYRVAPITLTGSTGGFSPAVPMTHLRALVPAAAEAPDWDEIAEAAEAAWVHVGSGAVTLDPGLNQTLAWTGLYAASESEEHEQVLEWNDRLGGSILQDRAFEHTARLAMAHAGLRQDEQAVLRAKEAVRVARLSRPSPAPERLIQLHRLVYEGGLVTESWEDVVSSGEALIQAAPLDADAAFLSTLARAQYEVGDMARSMDLVQVAMDEPGLDPQSRRSLTVLAFMASAANGEFDRALVYAGQVSDSVPVGLFTDFQIALADVRLETEQPSEAMAELLFLFQETPDPEPLLRPLFEETVLGVYGWLVETRGGATADAEDGGDGAGEAAGDPVADSTVAADGVASEESPIVIETPADFLAALDRRIPETARVRWDEIVERSEVVAVVVDTEASIGPGLEFFRNGDTRSAFSWFDDLDPEGLGDLQLLLSAQIRAWALYSRGLVEEANEAYRDVFEVDEDFILDDNVEYVREVFGFEIFTDEMLAHFRAVRPVL